MASHRCATDRSDPPEPAAAGATFSGKRLFIPISLGNHYYTNDVLTRISRQVVPTALDATIFLCDRLRSLIFQMRGIDDPGLAGSKVVHELVQFKRTLRNCGLEDGGNVRIATWSLIENDPRFVHILASLRRIVERDPVSLLFLQALCSRLVGRFVNTHPVSETALTLQWTYVYEETALSLFMTEVYGANVEVYRRKDEGLIRFLYEERPDLLHRLLRGTELQRTFVSLETVFACDDSGQVLAPR